MNACSHRRIVRLVAAALASGVVAAAAVAAPASAGGWAVGSLDAMPAAVAGETEEVGFTILQHGVTPADVTGEVGIEIVGDDGRAAWFPAAADGQPGHYVAAVTFPGSGGSYAWRIQMDWFGPQELGTLAVASPGGSGLAGSWPSLRWVVLAAGVGFATLAAVDLIRSRRRTVALAAS